MYIAIEGVDNVGKTTLIKSIKPYLTHLARKFDLSPIYFIAEPEIKLNKDYDNKIEEEFIKCMKYALQRIELCNIDEQNVISDRSVYSSFAYQGEHLNHSTIEHMNRYCREVDYVILLAPPNYADVAYPKHKYYTRYIEALDWSCVPYRVFFNNDENLVRNVVNLIISLLVTKEEMAESVIREIEQDIIIPKYTVKKKFLHTL